MRSPARGELGSVQLVLVAFSVALLAMSVLFDVAGLALRSTLCASLALTDLRVAAVTTLLAGLLALAHVPSTPAWSRARRLAGYRAASFLGAVALATFALASRRGEGAPFVPSLALALAAAAAGFGALGAWLTSEDAGEVEKGA